MKKVDHPNVASVHEVIDVTSDDALLSKLHLFRTNSPFEELTVFSFYSW
jgi:hypothetical protein